MKKEFTLSVRPMRYAYFIAENDVARFMEVASFCCTQWGGINNLIIPLDTTMRSTEDSFQIEPALEHIMTRRSPDMFIDALIHGEEAHALSQPLQKYLARNYAGKPVLFWNKFLEEDITLHPLHIPPEPVPSGFFGQNLNLSVPVPNTQLFSSDVEQAAFVAAFGRIWPGQEKAYQKMVYAAPLHINGIDYYLRTQRSIYPYHSPINFTLKGLSAGFSPLNTSPYLDVVIAQTIRDVCWFWNLRAESFARYFPQGREVLILSLDQLLSSDTFEVILQLLRERQKPSSLHSDVEVIFHHHDERVSQFLLAQPGLRRWEGAIHVDVTLDTEEHLSSRKSVPEVSSSTDTPISYAEERIEYGGVYQELAGSYQMVSVDLIEGENILLLPTPDPAIAQAGMVSLGLQSSQWEQFPAHAAVAQLIGKQTSFERFGGLLQLNYPILLRSGTTKVSLTLPTTWDVYRAYFQARGYKVGPSDKMAYANGLLERAGGLEQAEVLRSRIAYQVLESLADKRTKKLAQELRKQGFSDKSEADLEQALAAFELFVHYQRHPRSFEKIQSTFGIRGPGGLRIIAELVRIKAVQRGLLITCPHCHTPIWYGIGVLDEQIKCLGCLEIFDLPLTEELGDRTDRPMQFSLNPLANRAMDQDVLPVIAALLTLKTHHVTMAHTIPGMLVMKEGKSNQVGDFDFIYIQNAALYGGECKAGGILGEKDINTARLAEELGFRAFFFATTATFAPESKQLIEAYTQELAQQQKRGNTFDVFTLEGPVLFAEAPLPDGIPL